MTQASSPGPSLIPPSFRIPRCGKWLPEDTWILRTWLFNLVSHVDQNPKPLHPVLVEFQTMIEDDPVLYMLFHEMFTQTPACEAYSRDPFASPQVRSYTHLLQLINELLTRAPIFADRELVGLPLNALLDWPMSTPAGQTAFLLPKVNAHFKKLLLVWTTYLTSKESTTVLNESQSGWLGPPAMAALRASSTSTRRSHKWSFETTFICNATLPHYGFKSWDDFFTRRFRPGVRPVAHPHDDNVITNVCEAAPYRLYTDVKKYDTFWVKGQNYSLLHMLGNDELAEGFVGGTVYQACLDAVGYHRWHSPVSGIVAKTRLIPGAYFSQVLVEGVPVLSAEEVGDPSRCGAEHSRSASVVSTATRNTSMTYVIQDTSTQSQSQAYNTAVSTRALIFIKADNPCIGMVCVMPVGMAEVSTCEVLVKEDQRVRKGDEMGMFHYGGSSYVLLVRKGVDLRWGLKDAGGEGCVRVNEGIARVVGGRDKGREKERERLVDRRQGSILSRTRRRLNRDELWSGRREDVFWR